MHMQILHRLCKFRKFSQSRRWLCIFFPICTGFFIRWTCVFHDMCTFSICTATDGDGLKKQNTHPCFLIPMPVRNDPGHPVNWDYSNSLWDRGVRISGSRTYEIQEWNYEIEEWIHEIEKWMPNNFHRRNGKLDSSCKIIFVLAVIIYTIFFAQN